MTFQDKQLQKHYERVVSVMRDCPRDQLPVCALLDAWHWFRLIEGDESLRVREAIECLLSLELRPALRAWYCRFGNKMNSGAKEFRDHLSAMAGEEFG